MTTITKFITVDFGVKLLLAFVIICVYVTLLIFFNITVSFFFIYIAVRSTKCFLSSIISSLSFAASSKFSSTAA